MSARVNKAAFIRTYEELFNQGDLAHVEELIALDFRNREAPPGRNRGPKSLCETVMMLRTAFPNLHFTIEEIIAEGDTVAGRLTMRGTQQGPLMGLPATGKAMEQAHMHFVRFRDGKAIEQRA